MSKRVLIPLVLVGLAFLVAVMLSSMTGGSGGHSMPNGQTMQGPMP